MLQIIEQLEKMMIKRITTIAWTVVFVAIFVEVILGARTAYDVIHPRPATPTPTQPTPTRSLPTATPAGWKLYTSPRLGISLYYPATWAPVPADSNNQTTLVDTFKGPDGFFELDTVQNNTVIDKLCDLQAHGHSEYFGVTPHTTREQVANMPACLIEPGNDNPPQRRSQALLQSPLGDPSFSYISLSTDPEHFARIIQSVSIDTSRRPTPTVTPGPVSTPLPAGELPTPVLVTSHNGGVTLDDYSIVSALVDTPNHPEFLQRIPSGVFANHAYQREPDLAARLVAANALLSPMNWRFDPDSNGTGFNIFQNNKLVKASLVSFTPIQVNHSTTDFKTLVADASGSTWLLQFSGLTGWSASQHFNVPPVFIDDDVVTLDLVSGSSSQLSVVKAGTSIFTISLDLANPRLSLTTLDGKWYLDANGMLFQDGQLLNRSLGYDEIFDWQVLNGKPFYFFTQTGQTGISYNNIVLPVSYNEVIHDGSAFSAQGNGKMVWFYARENGFWNYVEIGSW